MLVVAPTPRSFAIGSEAGGGCVGPKIGLVFAKYLASRWRRCRFRKGLGFPTYEGKLRQNADVVGTVDTTDLKSTWAVKRFSRTTIVRTRFRGKTTHFVKSTLRIIAHEKARYRLQDGYAYCKS